MVFVVTSNKQHTHTLFFLFFFSYTNFSIKNIKKNTHEIRFNEQIQKKKIMKNRCIIVISSSSSSFGDVCFWFICFLFFICCCCCCCCSSFIASPSLVFYDVFQIDSQRIVFSIVSLHSSRQENRRFIYMSESSGPIFEVSTIGLCYPYTHIYFDYFYLSHSKILWYFFYETRLTFSNRTIIYCIFIGGFLWFRFSVIYFFSLLLIFVFHHIPCLNHNCVQWTFYCLLDELSFALSMSTRHTTKQSTTNASGLVSVCICRGNTLQTSHSKRNNWNKTIAYFPKTKHQQQRKTRRERKKSSNSNNKLNKHKNSRYYLKYAFSGSRGLCKNGNNPWHTRHIKRCIKLNEINRTIHQFKCDRLTIFIYVQDREWRCGMYMQRPNDHDAVIKSIHA